MPVASTRCEKHGEEISRTVDEARRTAKSYERIHVHAARKDIAKAVDEEFLIDDHDGDGEKKLIKADDERIVLHRLRNGKCKKHVPHRNVEKRHEEHERHDKAAQDLRRLMIFKRLSLFSHILRPPCPLAGGKARAVARMLDGGADRLRRLRRIVAYEHRIRQKVYGHLPHAIQMTNRLVNTRTARRARHARDLILFIFRHKKNTSSLPMTI